MDLDYAPIPEICRSVGLSCKSCTEDSAKSLAKVCKGLKGKAVTQLFFQIYPVSACSPMSPHFARAYKAATLDINHRQKPAEVEENVSFTRKEVTRREVGGRPVSGRPVNMYGARAVAAVA
jgi:hypothetical protein